MRESTKQRLIIFLMLVSYAPFVVFASLPSANTNSLVSYFASQLGYIAAMLFLWQFILGSRFITKPLLRLKDHAWALKWHKNIGIYGIVLVLLHPILVMAKYDNSISYLFFGPLGSEYEKHVAMGRAAAYIFLLTWVLSAVLRSKIGYRPWKYLHYLTYLLMPLVLLHAPELGSFYLASEAIRIYWYAISAIFAMVALSRIAQFFTFGQKQYRLIAKKEIADQTYLYNLEPTSRPINSAPGQYLYLRRSFSSEEHPFSVLRYDEKTGNVAIAVKIFGKYTTKLSNLELGEVVYLDGAYGLFTAEMDDSPTTFIAGGIGVTPFVQHILSGGRKDLTLFYCNRSRTNIAFGTALKKALGRRFINVLSEEKVKGCEHGYISAAILQKHLGDKYMSQRFYICGPPAMMKAAKQELLESGVDPDMIHTEEFSF